MPERPRSLAWRQAALRLEARLRELSQQVPERLSEAKIQNCYPTRQWVAAWRIAVEFSDGITRRIDIVATAWFPIVPIRTALVDHPDFMTWPHVERDGILCLLPNLAECDPDDPADVAANLLNRSVTLIEELLDGSIIERDFREEFLTYWAYQAHFDGARLVSLLDPAPPSRRVKVWRGEGLEVVGEDADALVAWVYKRFGPRTKTKLEDAAFLWLGEPLLPASYPQTAADLRALAADLDNEAVEVLDDIAANEPDWVVAILGALGRGGAGLIAVKVPNPKHRKAHPRAAVEPLSRGFRIGRTPKPVLIKRLFGQSQIVRSSVSRADAPWVHGRARDPRTVHLLGATVVLFGCGSIGAPIACALAQAGIGRLVLVDHDDLSWPNVGRHPLGASAVGRNKAEALAERLQTDYPHLTIQARNHGLHQTIQLETELLVKADLIIAATGSWSAENALNRWHVENARRRPVLYSWTEAHACAGHGVVIAGEGGCLQCHVGRTGEPSFKVVEWPDGEDANQEEPACGAHYQPYGPTDLAYVTAMLSNLALDCLLKPPPRSFNQVIAASRSRIEGLGGRFTEDWLSSNSESAFGVQMAERDWATSHCSACTKGAAARAA